LFFFTVQNPESARACLPAELTEPTPCLNEATFVGSVEKIKALSQAVFAGNFFGHVYPEPDYGGNAQVEAARRYHFRTLKWGTSFKCRIEDIQTARLSVDGTTFTVVYVTAFAAPLPIYAFLCDGEMFGFKVKATYVHLQKRLFGLWEGEGGGRGHHASYFIPAIVGSDVEFVQWIREQEPRHPLASELKSLHYHLPRVGDFRK
jgi:hypothetical protein